jgi:aldehyde:ferredoxin oxidoreductase
MALAYGTSPIGAHHKDAWAIGFDVQTSREDYGRNKAEKVIELQHTRGVFECFGVCRFPLVNLDLEAEWYPKFLRNATGQEFSWDGICLVAERVFNLVRAFWIREYGGKWTRDMDTPPTRWFKHPLSQGGLKGAKLDPAKYDALLSLYYAERGWDERGMPKKSKLKALGLGDVAEELDRYVALSE